MRVVTGIPPRGTDLVAWMRLHRNARIQVGFSVATAVALIVGAIVQWVFLREVGLARQSGYRGDGDLVYPWLPLIFATVFLVRWRVNDGERYHFPRSSRRPSVKVSALVLAIFVALAAVAGELAMRPLLDARTRDSRILQFRPAGSDAESMAAGVVDALLLYYATVALVVLVHLVGLWFNPAALKTYDWVGKRLSDKWPSWRH